MITFIGSNDITPGGVQVLIINLITEFSNRGIKTKLYCSKKCYIYRKLAQTDVDFIHIDADKIGLNQIDKHILSNDTLVITSIGKELLHFKKSTPKFIYWVVVANFEQYSYFTLFNGRIRLKVFEVFMKRIIDEMISSRSLFFMDGSTLKDAERIYGRISNPNFIPIPIQRKNENLFHSKLNNSLISKTIRITYLGRGSTPWKIYPITHFVEEISKMYLNVKCDLLIITDTDVKYKQALNHLASDKLSISFNLNVDHDEIDEFLLANSDLHVAMGTSALEGAKLGIPTILIDASNQPFPGDYKYRWIFESNTDYTLGYWIDKDLEYLTRGSPLSSLLDQYIIDKSIRMKISDLCFEYTIHNHDILNVSERLLDACELTKSDVHVFKKFNPIIQNIKLRYLIRDLLK